MKKQETKFDVGEEVRHITDPKGSFGIITAISIRSNNYTEYEVAWQDRSVNYRTEIELISKNDDRGGVGFQSEKEEKK